MKNASIHRQIDEKIETVFQIDWSILNLRKFNNLDFYHTPLISVQSSISVAKCIEPDYDSYTQMIWKASTTLACANAYIGDSENLVVCRYTPGGNIAGEYAQNIGEALL